jgi:hypothetical protein
MTEITIKLPPLRKEMWLLALSFALAILVNIYAIYTFRTPWIELITSLPWVFAATLVLYGLIGLVRVAIYLVIQLGKALLSIRKRDPS